MNCIEANFTIVKHLISEKVNKIDLKNRRYFGVKKLEILKKMRVDQFEWLRCELEQTMINEQIR